MQVGAAISRTEDAGIAAAEAADAAAQSLDGPADLAVVVVSGLQAEGLRSAAAAVRGRVDPAVLLGAAAQGVVGPSTEIEGTYAVSVWCARWEGDGIAEPFHTSTIRTAEGAAVVGWPETREGDTTLLLADPHTYPASQVIAHLRRERPGHPVVGGLVTTGERNGRLLIAERGEDPEVRDEGAVGVVLRDVDVELLVSQGCRPVGEPMVITQAEHNVIQELAGQPAIDRLRELFDAAEPQDRRLMQGGLHVGIVADEYRDRFDTGDFLVRAVLGADDETGAVAVGDHVEVGQVVQFQVRDAESAHDDLVRTLEGRDPAAGALLFTCNGRGLAFFGEQDHDARMVSERLGDRIAGAFCAGEIGPVGSGSHVHGFTASLAVFRNPGETHEQSEGNRRP